MHTHPPSKKFFTLLICLALFLSTLISSADAIQITTPAIDYNSKIPASFQNVEYKLLEQDNIVQMDTTELLSKVKTGAQVASLETDPGLTPREIISETGYIQENVLKQYSSKIRPGTVFVDVKNKTAFKVGAVSDANLNNPAFAGYTTLEKAAPYEVLEDFKIPPQTVTLNRANITHYAEGMKDSLVNKGISSTGSKTYTMSASASSDEYSGKALEELGPKKLKDPFLEFKFDKKKLTGYTPSGGKVEVQLSGYLGIDKIDVDGEYTCKSGYEFYVKTGEEIYLKAVVTANINEEILIPIVGISIDAKVAEVTGGLFLVVGLDGQFTLSAEVRQWLFINKAGIHGGTFFYVPTSFKPLFKLGDSGIDGDASFRGAVNGYIKAGPLLNLELFGFDAAGAGALFGGGASCTVNDGYIDADIYGSVDIFTKLMGHKLNLLNYKPTLFHKRQLDTEGYVFSFNEACAYRKTIWGRIEFDYGINGGLLPYKNGMFRIKITDANGKVKLTSPWLFTNEGGRFVLKKVDMEMGDKIYIIVPSKITPKKTIQSNYINPTFPFDKVVIEEMDFFNDFIKGCVPSVRVKNWESDQFEEWIYQGNVSVTLKNKNGASYTYDVPVDSYGRFVVENKLPSKDKPGVIVNVLPDSSSTAKINFAKFSSVSNNDTIPSVNIVGNRLPVATGRNSIDEGDRRVESLSENETFIVYNLNGSKILTGNGKYNSRYRIYRIENIIDPHTGAPIDPYHDVAVRQAGITLFPFVESKVDDKGASFVINNFNTKWAWAPFPATTEEGPRSPTGAPGSPITVIHTAPLPAYTILKLLPGRPSSSVQEADKPQNTIDFRYNSDYKYPEQSDQAADSSHFLMVGALRRYGELEVTYEGATITIKDPADADKEPRGKKTLYKDAQGLSMDRYLSRMFWATVSPTPDADQLNEKKISNFSSLPSWSSAAVKSMVNKGILDLGANQTFKSGKVTRGECAAYLARAFGLAPQVGRGKFTDIPTMFPYLPEINAAVSAGLIDGYGGTSFGPFDKVSREQMAAMVMRGLKSNYGSRLAIPSSSQQFSDIGKVSTWAATAVRQISALGIMNGSNGKFSPKSPITFNEMAVMLDNLSQYKDTHF